MEKRRKIILDCDPGQDDAVAIMLAANAPELEVLGITVVAGNQTLENTKQNACKVLQWIGAEEIPVYAGCPGPMVRPKRTASDIHGSTGLDGPAFPPLTKMTEPEHGVSFLIRTLLSSPEKITVVTTGPMTNLAMAIRLEPRITEHIERIVLMGGSYSYGNVSPAAEFNMLADPEAAQVCFTSGCPITMVGLDVTRKAMCTPEIVHRMARLKTRSTDLFCQLMTYYCGRQKAVYGRDGGPLHDPVTIASLLKPDLLTLTPMYVEIDWQSPSSAGRTNCDVTNYYRKKPNVDVATDIDTEQFWNLLEHYLSLR